MSDAKNYMSWVLDAFGPYLVAPVLEVGLGHGSYASVLRSRGAYMGIDIDEISVTAAKERFPELELATADITSPALAETLGGRKFRSIVCLNVLEHVPDHAQAVNNLAGALMPGGNLLIMVPALPMLFNDLDRLAGHQRRYRRSDLRDLLTGAGLRPVRSDYFNSVGGLGWWANRLKTYGSLNDDAVNSQITLFDRWLVPLSRGIDPLTRSFFGQSVLAIGQKVT